MLLPFPNLFPEVFISQKNIEWKRERLYRDGREVLLLRALLPLPVKKGVVKNNVHNNCFEAQIRLRGEPIRGKIVSPFFSSRCPKLLEDFFVKGNSFPRQKVHTLIFSSLIRLIFWGSIRGDSQSCYTFVDWI